MNYLGNAFSLQMVNGDCEVSVRMVSHEDIPADAISCIGHKDTAAVVGGILNRPVLMNRISVRLDVGDTLYVAQLVGGRLPEGSTTIPDGMSVEFLAVSVRYTSR